MAKSKKSLDVVNVDKTLDTPKSKPEPEDESKSMSQGKESLEKNPESKEPSSRLVDKGQVREKDDTGTTIRILFHGNCPKLTMRGVGELEYEIGINDANVKNFWQCFCSLTIFAAISSISDHAD